MSDPTRARLTAVFDEELAAAPIPPGLRALSIQAAVAAPRRRPIPSQLLGVVAVFVMAALIATLVVGSHFLRSTPTPAGSTTPPPARGAAAVAYDQARGVMVLFGGAGSPALGDTWTWDGKYWTQRHPAVSPAPRYYAAMAYDEARHETVMYGGTEGRMWYQDTWAWNGAAWQARHTAHEPVFGYAWQAPVMAFDPVSRRLLLSGFTNDYRPQAWSWNGSDWTLLSTGSAAGGGSIAIFSAGDRLLTVAAGPDLVRGRYPLETKIWNGSAWTRVDTPFTPALAPMSSSAYDVATKQLVVLGGDTWTWDGTRWARQHPSVRPASVGYMVYMPSLHEVVSWGDVTSRLDNSMYAWDGIDWKLIAPNTVAPGSSSGATGPSVAVMSPTDAATTVRRAVTNSRPVLLPTYLPSFVFDANVSATRDYFDVRYQSDLRDRSVDFGIMVANPPPGGVTSRSMPVKFRNAVGTKGAPNGYAEYFVYDTTSATSARWLEWIEPGTMTNPQLAGPGVPYFLSADGLTDAEFWQVANSLR